MLTAGVLVLLVGSSVWRALDYSEYGWFHATLSTIDRMDSILWGVAVALLARRLTMVRDRPTAFLGAGTLLVLGCVVSTAFFGLEAYFTVVGPVIGFATAMVVLADRTPRSDHGYAERLWTWVPLVALGMRRRGGVGLLGFWLIVAAVVMNLWGVIWGNVLGW